MQDILRSAWRAMRRGFGTARPEVRPERSVPPGGHPALRPSLSAIIGLAGMLRDTSLTVEQQTMLAAIERSAEGLLAVLEGRPGSPAAAGPARREALPLPARPPADARPEPPPAPPTLALVDADALAMLRSVGGPEFVAQLVAEFIRDAQDLVAGIELAVQEHDCDRFRDYAHSLRGITANMGALALYQLCAPWDRLPSPAVERDGAQMAGTLRQLWEQSRREFQALTAGAPVRDAAGGRAPGR